ncbi:hypothetical protein ACJA3G_37155, partial [Streptomyces sp. YS-3]
FQGLPGGEGDGAKARASGSAGPSGKPSGRTSPAASGGSGAAQQPPKYIENNRVSRDYWTLSKDPVTASHGVGECRTIGGEGNTPAEFQTAVEDSADQNLPYVAKKAKIVMRMKDAELKDAKPAPYYISVGVKPPHEIDPGTGKPFVDLTMENKSIGYTSRPVDIYRKWKSGEFIELTYPDDYTSHFGGRTEDAIPVANDPGDWTVVFYHVRSSPTDYASIACSGFRVK